MSGCAHRAREVSREKLTDHSPIEIHDIDSEIMRTLRDLEETPVEPAGGDPEREEDGGTGAGLVYGRYADAAFSGLVRSEVEGWRGVVAFETVSVGRAWRAGVQWWLFRGLGQRGCNLWRRGGLTSEGMVFSRAVDMVVGRWCCWRSKVERKRKRNPS